MKLFNDKNHLLLLNFLLFQIGWFACVLGGNAIALLTTLAVLAIHFGFVSHWKKEREVLATTLLLGGSIDSFLSHLGIITFPGDSLLIPPWLACLWVLFGTTLRHSLLWTSRYKLAGALCGAIAGSLSYYAGSQLTDVQLATPLWIPLLVYAIVWLLLIPLLQSFSNIWLIRYKKNCLP
ncbi:DUF2878 domain-containing protein [Endozoicomonas sp. Mp262]|uniref:DUF2878 domain-containing protein n=1 Tax=Endozoicomonas sp. Mp262 TaxID=2919499 RepID=UPI0021D80866